VRSLCAHTQRSHHPQALSAWGWHVDDTDMYRVRIVSTDKYTDKLLGIVRG
jgi:hypothetical protein